ncbi:UNVERIFIED_CONTAM: hypothetical protein Slati_2430200 [Sesamum latifolium]|uniref:DUF4218 domain-containing protein n=1 Tax=Sesamum latifolium TaxID=2727402 RepID=A0AAW2WGF5_9LAMI
MKEFRLHGMKSHDCHFFMQKLIPIAFREMLPKSVWSALTERAWEGLYNTGGCIHLSGLKMKVKNKAHMEASIVEAYLVEEISIFTSQHFEPQVLCKRNRPSRNDDLAMNDTRIQQSIFNLPGSGIGASKKRWLIGLERHIIETYILTNYEVVTPYYESFLNELYEHCDSEDPIVEELVATQFKDWFKHRVKDVINYMGNELLKLHYWGPTVEVTTFPCYFVNGYNCHTEHHSIGKSTFNCGVCVKSSSYTDTDSDFYGILEEVIQLDYPFVPNMQIVLFKYRWVNPVRVPSMKRDKADWMAVCKIKAKRVVDDSRWTEVTFQEDESIRTPQVLTDDHNYALHDPNGIQLVVDLNQQGKGTSRAANGESDDEPDEDSFDKDYEIELDNYD